MTISFLERRLFAPLRMTDTGFSVPDDKSQRLATVHRHKGGSFGLVATAQDYWCFAQMMLNGGQLDGVRILSPHTVAFMTRDHLGDIQMPSSSEGHHSGMGFGLGFAVMKDPAAAGYISSEGSFGWAGAAATLFWVDPKEDMVVVAMTQHMGVPAVESLSSQIPALVYSALLREEAQLRLRMDGDTPGDSRRSRVCRIDGSNQVETQD